MPTKQTIIVRSDLKMRRGKEIAQGSHASMAWITCQLRGPKGWLDRLLRKFGLYRLKIRPEQQTWLDESFTKICLKCDSEQQLLDVAKNAEAAGLEVQVIVDSGLTEFNGVPTRTCVAIGPGEAEIIDPITKFFRLY